MDNGNIKVLDVLEALEYYKNSSMPVYIGKKKEQLAGCYIDDKNSVMVIDMATKAILGPYENFYNMADAKTLKELYSYLRSNCSYDMCITNNTIGKRVTGILLHITEPEYVLFELESTM